MADQNQKLAFLKKNIEERLETIGTKRSRYKRQAFGAFIISTFLSAITTVLLGLNPKELQDNVRIIALILTTIITIIGAYNAFFSHKELWIANNVAQNRLRQLQFNIFFAEKGTEAVSEKDIEDYKKNYQDILNDLNATWQKNRLNTRT